MDLGQQVGNAARPDALTATSGGGDASRGRPVDIEDITHRYASLVAVDNVSLSIAAGEIAALLGPSGCGKTTLLRVIAGFVRQSAGRVRIDGQLIDHLPANQRNVGIVFQSYALFPHMSVAENVAYGLKARGVGREEVRTTVERFLDVVRLGELRDRLPRQFGLTAFLVTHDQDEAMSVADRIAVMNRGRVEQLDTPVAVYDRPASLFVSGFIGTTNLLRGRIVEAAAGTATVDLEAGARVLVPSDKPFAAGAAVVLSARPEQLRLLPREAPGCWPVWRRLTVPMGPSAVHDLQARDGATLKLVEPRLGAMMDGAGEAWCGLRPEARPAIFAATQ